MIGVDTIGEIRRAYFEGHLPIKEIVRTLSVSRSTVRKVIRSKSTEFKYTDPSRASSIRSCLDSLSRKPGRIIRPEESRQIRLAGGFFGFSQSQGIFTAVMVASPRRLPRIAVPPPARRWEREGFSGSSSCRQPARTASSPAANTTQALVPGSHRWAVALGSLPERRQPPAGPQRW